MGETRVLWLCAFGERLRRHTSTARGAPLRVSILQPQIERLLFKLLPLVLVMNASRLMGGSKVAFMRTILDDDRTWVQHLKISRMVSLFF